MNLQKVVGIVKIICAILFFTIGNTPQAAATHNRAGEITFEQIGDLTFRVTITTYTKASSIPADRDSLELFWGDGTSQYLLRSNGNGQGVLIGNDTKYNTYVGVHTYPGRGEYTLTMTDPNRNGGICNVNPPNSDAIPFHLETTFKILNTPFQGYNSSPVLLQPPVDIGYLNQAFIHTPNAFDLDGDSIAYELIVPLQAKNTPVVNYFYPNSIGGQSFITLNEVTGEFVWITPQVCCEYNIAILVKEYRGGQLISSMIRDMQITIDCATNRPPVLELIQDICVVAGDTVNFNVFATDPDAGQGVRLSATGGPFILSVSPATFNAPGGFVPPIVTGQFQWITNCDHIRREPYQIVFKAQDNFSDTLGASTLQAVRITVVAPPPDDVVATAGSGQVAVTWENPYSCDNLTRFEGFSVWRREGSNPFVVDTCETGLAGRGYVKIAERLKTLDPSGSGRYFHLDTDVESSVFYCYRILAEFSFLNNASQPLYYFESLPSEEVCVQLRRDLPLITHVTVNTTSITNGQVEVRWSKPVATDLDTLQNPPPYTYVLYRSTDFNAANPVEIAAFASATYWNANDTFFVDNALNTVSTPHSYEVELLVGGGNSLGTSREASSVFLSVASTDQTNILTWQENVGWDNFEYTIFKKDPNGSTFDSITTVTTPTYRDEGLTNGKNYCYYIRSKGRYTIPGITDPLINLSQEVCGIPIDTVPPCPPVLTVTNDCDVENPVDVTAINRLEWTNPNNTCSQTNDTYQYNVYYAANANAAFDLLATNIGSQDTRFDHDLVTTLEGCYYVTALDTLGNESRPSNIVCKQNCPDYRLPNVFTPNGDGANDVFLPFPYRFIDRIEMKIYNRWGGLVYETTDPDINWDGKNTDGTPLAEGVYFYTCRVFQLLNSPNSEPIPLEGYIQLIIGK